MKALLAALLVALAASQAPQALVEEALQLVPRLQALEEAGFNVTSLAEEVNRAIRLAEEGRTGEARAVLDQVEARIAELEAQAPGHARAQELRLYLEAIALALIPVAGYLLIPRAYLYLWARLRRDWVVEE